ncbi:MAG: WD40/YVTN/BNR-like repeat-containing protein, partial [Actinomycetota bacterium]
MARRTILSAGLILITVVMAGQKTDMSLFNGIKPRNIGPAGMSGRVTAFAVDPRNENVFYVGTASGGLWKTVNAGTTFVPLFDNEAVASIGALAIDPERPDIIWAGTGEGNPRNSVTGGYGIYRSNDGGRTWKCMGLELT